LEETVKKVIISTISIVFFIVGVVLGMGLLAITIWGDLEASNFDNSIGYEENIEVLDCPVLITSSEKGKVSAVFSNPHIRPIDRRIRVHISSGHLTLMREENNSLQLEPGDSEELSWEILPEDAAFGQIIMVRVTTFRSNPLPSQSSSCGIVVLDMPNVSGKLIFTTASIASGLFLLLGAGVFALNQKPLRDKPLRITQGMFFMILVLGLGLTVSIFGSWIIGLVLLVVAVLLMFTLPVSAMLQ